MPLTTARSEYKLTAIDSFDYETLLLPLTRLHIPQPMSFPIGFSVKNEKFNRTPTAWVAGSQ